MLWRCLFVLQPTASLISPLDSPSLPTLLLSSLQRSAAQPSPFRSSPLLTLLLSQHLQDFMRITPTAATMATAPPAPPAIPPPRAAPVRVPALASSNAQPVSALQDCPSSLACIRSACSAVCTSLFAPHFSFRFSVFPRPPPAKEDGVVLSTRVRVNPWSCLNDCLFVVIWGRTSRCSHRKVAQLTISEFDLAMLYAVAMFVCVAADSQFD